MRGKLNLSDRDYQKILRLFANRGKIRFKDFVSELVKPDLDAKYRGKGQGPLKSVTKLQYKLKNLVNWGILENHRISRREGYYTFSDKYKLEALRSFDTALIERFDKNDILARIDIPFDDFFRYAIKKLVKRQLKELPKEKRKEFNKTISEAKMGIFDLTKTLYGFKEDIFTDEEKSELFLRLTELDSYILQLRRKAYTRYLRKEGKRITNEINELELPKIHKRIIHEYIALYEREYHKSRREFQEKKSIGPMSVEFTNRDLEFRSYFEVQLRENEEKFSQLFSPIRERYTPEEAVKEHQRIHTYIEKYLKELFQGYRKYTEEFGNYLIVLKPVLMQFSTKVGGIVENLILGDLKTITQGKAPSQNTS